MLGDKTKVEHKSRKYCFPLSFQHKCSCRKKSENFPGLVMCSWNIEFKFLKFEYNFFIANESCLHNFQKPGNPERFEFFQIIFVSVWKNWKLFLSTKYKLFTVEEMKWASLSSYVSLELTLVIVICLQSRSTHSTSNGKSTLRLVHIVSDRPD